MNNFADELIQVMVDHPVSKKEAYQKALKDLEDKYQAVRDPNTKNWVLPDGTTVEISCIAESLIQTSRQQ